MSSMNFFTSKYLFRDIGLFFHAEMESSRLAGRTTRTVTSIKSLAFFQFVTNSSVYLYCTIFTDFERVACRRIQDS
jgi:hypothetical protein